MTDNEQKYTARQIVRAIKYLSSLSIQDMLDLDLIDYDALVEASSPKTWTVTLRALGDKRIHVIKSIRDASRKPNGDIMSLLEAKNLTDAVWEGEQRVVMTTSDYQKAEALRITLTNHGSAATVEEA